ncbi:MAG: tol-pal system-associated acyl-CoA thioesterase [Pseudomonadota bacterium]
MTTASEFHWPVRVYYEDTDAEGVVYYSNYLKFMERARTEWLRNCGFEQNDLRDEHQLMFVVRSLQIDYLKPAQFNDMLDVSVILTRAGRASLEIAQTVNRAEELLCTANVKIGSLHSETLKIAKMPLAVMENIRASN